MTTSVFHASSVAVTEARTAFSTSVKRASSSILRVPLLGKILGANLVLTSGALIAHAVFPDASMAMQLGVVLALSFLVTGALAWLALRPLAQLETVAEQVSQGDFAARVSDSPIADRNIARLSTTLNRLLDRVQADRARIQYLAGRSVRARDIERETVARELRDSLAQMVAGIALQLSATRQASDDPRVTGELAQTSELLQQLSDEMRSVAETLYPGTLGEFGLLNALSALGRITSRRSGVHIEVEAGPFDALLPAAAAGALYRVAEEALRNVAQHSHASRAHLSLRSGADVVVLEIEDDGRGIDLKLSDPLQAGLGLFSARAVLALVGGELQISSAPGKGTRVLARVPKKQSTQS
jgi:two-component system, NarL family, sensor histidine kinase UhpB